MALKAPGKLGKDIAWTVGSFVVLAASGVLINLAVAFLRPAEDLGIFNLSYAVYIIVSQLAVLGIHYSVLRHAALHRDQPEDLGALLGSAIPPVLALGLAAASAIVLAEIWIARAFDSVRAAQAISNAALGIAFFPVSKVLVSFLNGLRHMKAFAVLQSGRYIIVAAVAIGYAASDADFTKATLCFLIAEVATLVLAIGYIGWKRLVRNPRAVTSWWREHIRFGSRALAAGMFGEINTRVDVVCLGLFLSDREVGIYSFAALFLDGMYHLLAMVRVNFNPVLTVAVGELRWADAQRLLRLSWRIVPLIMLTMSVAAFAFFWLLTTQFFPERDFGEGFSALAILLVGLVLVSALVPFDNLLLMSNYPVLQTVQQAFAVLVNVAFNLALIPIKGIEGAAIGTAAGLMASVLALSMLSKRFLGWNLFLNRVSSQ